MKHSADDYRDLNLLSHHAEMLAASAIAPEVAKARGYRSLDTKAELERLGFGRAQRRVPGLLIPIWGVHGEIASYQWRPDQPRVRKDRVVKYETPGGSRLVLDVPPGARPGLGGPDGPLFITEGAKKADAGVSRGLCCVDILGEWAWRGRNAWDRRTAS